MPRIALLDDYHRLALSLADWSGVQTRAELAPFHHNLRVPDEAAEALRDFEAVCHIRERMAMPRALIERLPKLRFIAVTGASHRTLDLQACAERGIVVSHSTSRGPGAHGTPELTWALILAAVRHIAFEDRAMRAGGWQTTLGPVLHGKTLGLLGLGKVGKRVAAIGQAFGMDCIAWSPNMTEDAAAAGGARLVDREALFREADVLTVHLVLGERSRGVVGAQEFAWMKPTAFFVNTSRGPIVQEAALIEALNAHRIAGAALDVYDEEPLPTDSPLRRLENLTLSPHLGYVTTDNMRAFYEDTAEALNAWLDGKPIRVLSPK
jgi:phosphoglycerate dehydrogenase-like enzyme